MILAALDLGLPHNAMVVIAVVAVLLILVAVALPGCFSDIAKVIAVVALILTVIALSFSSLTRLAANGWALDAPCSAADATSNPGCPNYQAPTTPIDPAHNEPLPTSRPLARPIPQWAADEASAGRARSCEAALLGDCAKREVVYQCLKAGSGDYDQCAQAAGMPRRRP